MHSPTPWTAPSFIRFLRHQLSSPSNLFCSDPLPSRCWPLPLVLSSKSLQSEVPSPVALLRTRRSMRPQHFYRKSSLAIWIRPFLLQSRPLCLCLWHPVRHASTSPSRQFAPLIDLSCLLWPRLHLKCPFDECLLRPIWCWSRRRSERSRWLWRDSVALGLEDSSIPTRLWCWHRRRWWVLHRFCYPPLDWCLIHCNARDKRSTFDKLFTSFWWLFGCHLPCAPV